MLGFMTWSKFNRGPWSSNGSLQLLLILLNGSAFGETVVRIHQAFAVDIVQLSLFRRALEPDYEAPWQKLESVTSSKQSSRRDKEEPFHQPTSTTAGPLLKLVCLRSFQLHR